MGRDSVDLSQIFTDCQAICQARRVETTDVASDEKTVHDVVDMMSKLHSLDDTEKEWILKKLYETLYIQMDTGIAVYNHETYKPWLTDRSAEIDPFYWERYRKLLLAKGWTDKVVSRIGTEANNILDFLGNPHESTPWKRRGLIMGDVQSGKTANYTSLCNKAMDAGYKVVIILTGTQESLRKQTQERLDHELVGFASEMYLGKATQKQRVGVGKIDPKHDQATFTSKSDDFNQKLLATLGFKVINYTEPVLFVVKKQKQRLTYLYEWLKRENAGPDGLIDAPLLLIDDEADNASVNTGGEDNPTTINNGIRQLLHLFKRSSYVGVTATPYANIFIDPDHEINEMDDLFPGDFIYCLNAPSNYIGAQHYFGNGDGQKKIVKITDAETAFPIGHKKEDLPPFLPNSLEDALGYFILANAIMDSRPRSPKHRSMLVHVSRYVAVHKELEALVQLWLDNAQRDIQNFSGLPEEKACTNSTISALKSLWNQFGLGNLCNYSWEEFQQIYLHKAAAPIRIVVVNQKGSRLDYSQNASRIIAIGGDSLSRGLTLEGLCLSYFYRNSKAYDTLFQMGRWFGYRPDYDDLCKLWLSQDSIDSYIHITDATEELRSEIIEMNRYNLNPKQYGLMVRNHPDRVDAAVGHLMVTARNKMQATTEYRHVVSVNGQPFETPKLPGDVELLKENYDSVMGFLCEIQKYTRMDSTNPDIYIGPKNHLWINIPVNTISALVRNFRTDPLHFAFQPDALADYIISASSLPLWDVVVAAGDAATQKKIADINISFEKRTADTDRDGQVIRINGAHSRVGSRGYTSNGLAKYARQEIIADYKKNNKSPSDSAFLVPGRKPLLVIHFVEIEAEPSDKHLSSLLNALHEKDADIVAIGVAFPRSLDGGEYHTINYIINKVKLQELQASVKYDDAAEDDDIDG